MSQGWNVCGSKCHWIRYHTGGGGEEGLNVNPSHLSVSRRPLCETIFDNSYWETKSTMEEAGGRIPRKQGLVWKWGAQQLSANQWKYLVKEGNRRVWRRKMSPNLLFKLSWAPEISVSCLSVYKNYVCVYQKVQQLWGGWGVGLVSLRTHKRWHFLLWYSPTSFFVNIRVFARLPI